MSQGSQETPLLQKLPGAPHGSSWLLLAASCLPGSSWLLLAPLGSSWILLAPHSFLLKAGADKDLADKEQGRARKARRTQIYPGGLRMTQEPWGGALRPVRAHSGRALAGSGYTQGSLQARSCPPGRTPSAFFTDF